MSEVTGDSNVSGRGAGLRGYGAVVVRTAMDYLGKAPAYTAVAVLALLILTYVAYVNQEPIATAVGIVATAFFGSGAMKNFADQRYHNGGAKK